MDKMQYTTSAATARYGYAHSMLEEWHGRIIEGKPALTFGLPTPDKLAQANLWGSVGGSRLRLEELVKVLTLDHACTGTVLDVGCGTGELVTLLPYPLVTGYVGIDSSDIAIRYAEDVTKPQLPVNAPHVSFEWNTSAELLKRGDYYSRVFCSGMFNIGWTLAGAQDELHRLWSLADRSLSFNMLSTRRVDDDPDALYVSPAKMLDFVLECLSHKAILSHAYLPHDFTIHVFR